MTLKKKKSQLFSPVEKNLSFLMNTPESRWLGSPPWLLVPFAVSPGIVRFSREWSDALELGVPVRPSMSSSKLLLPRPSHWGRGERSRIWRVEGWRDPWLSRCLSASPSHSPASPCRAGGGPEEREPHKLRFSKWKWKVARTLLVQAALQFHGNRTSRRRLGPSATRLGLALRTPVWAAA